MRRRTLLACGAVCPIWAGADTFALVRHAEAGDLAALRKLLDEGVPVDARDSRRRTALLAATHANHIEVAQLLIQSGADVNAKDKVGQMPAGALADVRIRFHASLRARCEQHGDTALHDAARQGRVNCFAVLLMAGVDASHRNVVRVWRRPVICPSADLV